MLTAAGISTGSHDVATPLHDVTFVVLDLETTGASPGLDAITEIGALKFRGGECLGTFDTLVNPGVPIPPFITVLTGITESMVLPAPHIDEALPALLEFVGNAVLVGHNFRFDTGFLDAALLRRGADRLDHLRVDTLALSRRLLHDDVPDLRLSTLADHLRVPTTPCHRALADAAATAEVFHSLLERAGTLGVLGLDDLLALPRLRAHPSSNTLRLTVRAPRVPGVYRFRNRRGEVIFVGRATNLRTRIRAHFHTSPARSVPPLVRETHGIDWIECADLLEASVRHARLVREHEPRFNPTHSAWRSSAYVKVTDAKRPRVTVARATRDRRARYLGPLPDAATAGAVRDAIGAVLATDGAVDAVHRAFDGDGTALVVRLEERLRELVDDEAYEAAAQLRDQMVTVQTVVPQQARLGRLRRAGRLRFGTESGVVTFEHGRLQLPGEPPTPHDLDDHEVVDRRELDELHVVASWIDTEVAAGRARQLDP